MSTILYLIRHGETEDANPKRYKGTLNVPLSATGIQQIRRLADFLRCEQRTREGTEAVSTPSQGCAPALSAVYCSDLDRAVQSAGIIAKPFGIHPVTLKDLRERYFGQWEGMSFDEIRMKYPKEFRSWADDPLENSPVGGETTQEVRQRALNALDRILRDGPHQKRGHRRGTTERGTSGEERRKGGQTLTSQRIAVISHGGIIRILICHFLGIPLRNIFRIEQDFGALNVIELSGSFPTIHRMNYTV